MSQDTNKKLQERKPRYKADSAATDSSSTDPLSKTVIDEASGLQ